jgi:hypothetical protein
MVHIGSDARREATGTPCGVSAFGYNGYAKCNTAEMFCDYDGGGDDEAFVVTDSRRIWHAWPGSGGWVEMPNNGRADNVYNCYVDTGNHVVEVWVNGSGVWWSHRDTAGKWWGWYAK